jgi:transposase
MKAHPIEYRHRVLALTEDGQTTGEIAEALGVSGAWVRSIKARHRAGHSLAPKSSANKRRSLAEREGDRLRARVKAHPGTTLEDLKRDLNLDAAVSTIWNALRDLKLSLKKKTLHAAERDRPDVAADRAEWDVFAAGIDPRRLVFLDETFGTTAMTRLYGWGPTDERVTDAVPHGHWKTTTFLAAFRLGGLFAPLVIDGAVNGELFLAYVRQHLAPQLRPGDILVMDNLQTHKVAGVAAAVEARDARVLYLPPYSPDFNPIEEVFSKIKTELRRRELRTIPALEDAFGASLDWITRTDAINYFGHAGYPLDGN